jgi:hypothetical protein
VCVRGEGGKPRVVKWECPLGSRDKHLRIRTLILLLAGDVEQRGANADQDAQHCARQPRQRVRVGPVEVQGPEGRAPSVMGRGGGAGDWLVDAGGGGGGAVGGGGGRAGLPGG